jgi:hypothetical protein
MSGRIAIRPDIQAISVYIWVIHVEDSANLPDPEVFAADIMENLEGALELFRTINEKLK